MEAPAAAPGLFGPNADAEALVLALLNRQDRYLARRTCSTRRRELGAKTSTLVLSEDGEESKAPRPPTVHLASSFPALRTLVLRCKEDDMQGWPDSFAAFVIRNSGALQQLQHLDLCYEGGGGYYERDLDYYRGLGPGRYVYAPSFTSGVLAALTLLPALQSLYTTGGGEGLEPSSWAALAGLTQLTSLRISLLHTPEKQLQQIVDAAPQLQQLWLGPNPGQNDKVPCEVACLTGLRSLSSLQLYVQMQDAHMLPSFTALLGLTHLGLYLGNSGPPDQLLAAVAQLTGLASLCLEGFRPAGEGMVMPLATLQQLTSLVLLNDSDPYSGVAYLGRGEALVLASLGQLRRLHAAFASPAAAAAAGLARLEECKVEVDGTEPGGEPAASLSGRVELSRLAGFDLSRVHALSVRLVDIFYEDELEDVDDVDELGRHLPSCQQLCSLSIAGVGTVFVPSPAKVLQAVAALPQLQHLRLQYCSDIQCTPPAQKSSGMLAWSVMDELLSGCRQLKQLTLVGMVGLLEGTVAALMLLPRLRLLRLLGCSPGLSQERCQALMGQLRLYELQVDVVVDDGLARARWMMSKLGVGVRGGAVGGVDGGVVACWYAGVRNLVWKLYQCRSLGGCWVFGHPQYEGGGCVGDFAAREMNGTV
jgi:hypothetical protein